MQDSGLFKVRFRQVSLYFVINFDILFWQIPYLETSAKESINVDLAFHELVRVIRWVLKQNNLVFYDKRGGGGSL